MLPFLIALIYTTIEYVRNGKVTKNKSALKNNRVWIVCGGIIKGLARD